jgi:hypothetical protein
VNVNVWLDHKGRAIRNYQPDLNTDSRQFKLPGFNSFTNNPTHPFVLEQRARQRRRARQTHPGKRWR